MSLTGYFRDSPEARQQVRAALRRPVSRPHATQPLANARSQRYGLVGTAFDYLFRSLLVRSHAGRSLIHTGSPCIALLTIPEFARSNGSGRQKLEILHQAHDLRLAFETGEVGLSLDVARACLILASFDVVIRVGRYHELAGCVEDVDAEDLLNLAAIIPVAYFQANQRLILNPRFHHAWRVFGADGDVLIDDLLIDLKVTQLNKLRGEDLDQLTGYLALEHLGGVVGAGEQPIRRLGVYFARHGILHTWPVAELYQPGALPRLVAWLDDQWPTEDDVSESRSVSRGIVGAPQERCSLLQMLLDASKLNPHVPSPFEPDHRVPHVRSALVARRVGWALLGPYAAERDVLIVAGLLASCPVTAAPLDHVRACLSDVERTRQILAASKHTDIWYASTHDDLKRCCKRILKRLEKALAVPLSEDEARVLDRLLPVALPLDDHGKFTRGERSWVKALVARGLVMQDGRTYMRLNLCRCSPVSTDL